MILLVVDSPPWHDALALQRDQRALVLQLTVLGDPVMDAKGETVFRRRPFYYALETVTRQRLDTGLTPDTIVDDLRKTKTHVVIDRGLPPRNAGFVATNYLLARKEVRVAGKRLRAENTQTVRIEIPGDYTLLARAGPSRASMDGTAFANSWYLTTGLYTLRMATPTPALLVWSPALARGLDPAALWANEHP